MLITFNLWGLESDYSEYDTGWMAKAYAKDYTGKTEKEVKKSKKILEGKLKSLTKQLKDKKKELEDAITWTQDSIDGADTAIANMP